jgi:hypothetical protein
MDYSLQSAHPKDEFLFRDNISSLRRKDALLNGRGGVFNHVLIDEFFPWGAKIRWIYA